MSSAIAAIHYPRGFNIDGFLIELCSDLSNRGFLIGGLLQVMTGEHRGGRADHVRLVDLRTRATFDIW